MNKAEKKMCSKRIIISLSVSLLDPSTYINRARNGIHVCEVEKKKKKKTGFPLGPLLEN